MVLIPGRAFFNLRSKDGKTLRLFASSREEFSSHRAGNARTLCTASYCSRTMAKAFRVGARESLLTATIRNPDEHGLSRMDSARCYPAMLWRVGWQGACYISGKSRMASGGFVKRIQTFSFLATLAIAIGMISWGSALHAQDTTPSTPDRQAQQPSTPDTAPPQQAPETSPSKPDNQQYPSSQQTPSQQQPDSSQPPDSTAPSGRTPQSGAQRPSDSAGAGTDTQTFSGTVMKQGDKYMLKDDSGHVYDIDHQDEVKKFDGKRVRVQGTLDPSGNKIMVK